MPKRPTDDAAKLIPDRPTLPRVQAAAKDCQACDLWKRGTQTVFGEGGQRAELMFVGEQPGNDEDLAGHPFVGPAGRMLDRAIDEAGLQRGKIFVTNAVKHFKFEPRGKRRLHKRPNAYEIDRCHLWFDFERKLIKPELIVAMGATAVRSVSGKPLAINKIRGRVLTIDNVGRMLATIHPSYILRVRESDERHALFAQFVADLKICARVLAKEAA
jgi:uracil-DNA glycosylase